MKNKFEIITYNAKGTDISRYYEQLDIKEFSIIEIENKESDYQWKENNTLYNTTVTFISNGKKGYYYIETTNHLIGDKKAFIYFIKRFLEKWFKNSLQF